MAANFATGWRQVWICLVLLASVGMIAMTYSILAVPLAEEFKPSRMVLMLAMTIMSLSTAVLSPYLGNLMDRISLRTIMIAGAALLVAGFLAVSFATSFTQVLVVYGVLLAPANLLIGPMAVTVLLSRWFVKSRGRALGVALAGLGAGGFVFPPLIQGLLDAFEWREGVRWLALFLAALTIPAALLVINRPSDKGLHADGADQDPEVVSGGGAAPVLSARAILSDPTFWLLGLIFAVVLSGMKGMVTNLVPLADDEGVDLSIAAYLISVYAAAGFAAKFVFAAVSDKINPRLLLLAALVGVAIGMAILVFSEAGFTVIAIGVGMCGLFGGLIMPLQSLLVPRIFGTAVVGRVSGLLNLYMLVFLLSSPPVFGLIFDLSGSYDAIFMIFAGLAIAMLLLVPLVRTEPREAAVQEAQAAPAA